MFGKDSGTESMGCKTPFFYYISVNWCRLSGISSSVDGIYAFFSKC